MEMLSLYQQSAFHFQDKCTNIHVNTSDLSVLLLTSDYHADTQRSDLQQSIMGNTHTQRSSLRGQCLVTSGALNTFTLSFSHMCMLTDELF